MNRKYLWIAGAAVGAAALLAWAFAPRPLQVEAASVTLGRFEQSIEEDGQTRLRERYTVSAPVAARLLRIVLREGDPVAAGDAVATLVPVMSSMVDARSATEARARHLAAGAGVQRAAARISRARVAVEDARLELQRTERLAREGFLAPSRLDSARLALEAAQREADIARTEREVALQDQAQAAAALLPAGSAQMGQPLVLRAPVAGVVLKVAQASEATLPAGADDQGFAQQFWCQLQRRTAENGLGEFPNITGPSS